METLHLSYDEVVNKIPYRTLMIMQKDKLHVSYSKKKKIESTPEDFRARHGIKRKKKHNEATK